MTLTSAFVLTALTEFGLFVLVWRKRQAARWYQLCLDALKQAERRLGVGRPPYRPDVLEADRERLITMLATGAVAHNPYAAISARERETWRECFADAYARLVLEFGEHIDCQKIPEPLRERFLCCMSYFCVSSRQAFPDRDELQRRINSALRIWDWTWFSCLATAVFYTVLFFV
jgi:hypothetical protein